MEEEFLEKLRKNPHPVIVDFWASWCVPCRVIAPAVEKLGTDYAGRVDLWKVNADENPDLLQSLHIYGIPTLIAYRDGQEVDRHSGTASATVLASLFETALGGEKLVRNGLKNMDRLLRLGAGLALIGLAILSGLSGTGLLVAGLGALVMFTAVYDRCPIYRMVSTRMKAAFQRKSTQS